MDENEFGLSGVKAYPNPVTDRIYIQFSPDAEVEEDIAVYDIQGKFHAVNYIWSTTGNQLEVDMSKLFKGEYIIVGNINNTNQMIRIVKLR